MRPRLAALLSPLIACSGAVAGTDPAPVVERIEVRLAQFDVVVRDKSGAFLAGLPADQFSVLEDGSPLEVVAVDEWGAPPPSGKASSTPAAPGPSAESAPAAPVSPSQPDRDRRSFVLVFDALGDSTALRMNQAKRAAMRFVGDHLRADDLAAVYQLDLSLRAVSGITSNRDEITRAIESVAWMPASSLQDQIAESVLAYGSAATVPAMRERLANQSASAAQQLDWQREHVYSSLNDLASLFGALPGRRILVLVSPGFPLTTAGEQFRGSGGFTPRFRELIRSLAKYGVTVYSLDIGNDLAMGDASEKIDWRIAVGKLGMDENTLSDLGLERSMGTSSASSRREFLGVIAAETGGRLLTQTDLTKAFDAIQEESSHFYRISVRVPVSPGGERYRRIVVKLKTAGSVVSSRRGRFSDITPFDRTPGSKSTAVESLDRYAPLASRGIALPLPGTDPDKIPVAVVVETIGPVQLALDAQGGAALDVEFRLVARVEGEIVDRYERSFTARVKPAGVAAIREAFRVEGRLTLPPGVYEIQASVRLGAPAQLARWSATVAVPPSRKSSSPTFTGAVLNAVDGVEAPLLSRPGIAEEADPLAPKPGVRVLPSTHPDFEAGTNLLVLFWLRGFPGADGKPPDIELGIHVADKDGRDLPVPTKVLLFGREPSGGYRAVARVDTQNLPSGSYTLRLAATVPSGEGDGARKNVPFVLRAKAGPVPTSTSSSAVSPSARPAFP